MRNVTSNRMRRLVETWYFIGAAVFFIALSFVTGCSKAPVIGEGESDSMIPLSMVARVNAGLTKAPVTGESVPTGRTLIVSAYRNAPGGTGSASYATALPFTHSTSTTWACASGYWPMDGTLDFLAYSLENNSRVSGVTWGSNNSASVTMTLANNASNQDDLIVGGSSANTSSSSLITFRHAESLLTFKGAAYADYDAVNNTGVTITDVRVVNANHSGTVACTRSENNVSFAWSSLGNASTVSLPSLTATHLTETMSLLAGTPGLIVPPQAQKNITVYYTMHMGKDGGGNPVDVSDSYTYEASGTWEPSTRYIYEIEFSGAQIVINLTLAPWGEVTHEIAVADPVYSFGGLEIAPGNLVYDGVSAYYMLPNWDDYSEYISYYQLGNKFQSPFDGKSDIVNTLDPFDGWRLPTRAEWLTITRGVSPGVSRPGSTVNGNSGVKFTIVYVDDNVYCLLLFPDGETITGSPLLDYTNGFPTTVTNLTTSEVNTYISQGCACLSAMGYYNTYASTPEYWLEEGYYMSSTYYDNGNDCYMALEFGASGYVPVQGRGQGYYPSVRLVREIP